MLPSAKSPTGIEESNLTNMTTSTQYDPGRLRYVSGICLGTTLLWFLLRYLGDADPVWAIISFIVVSDSTIEKAHPNFLSRITNTIVGCTMGVAFVIVFGSPGWLLPISVTGTALIASLLVKGSSNWKLAIATAALIVSAAIIDHSGLAALEQALRRTAEVALGSITAVLISWLFSTSRQRTANPSQNDKP